MFDYNEGYIHRVKNFIDQDDAEYLLSVLDSLNTYNELSQKEIILLENLHDKKAQNIVKECEKKTYLEIVGNYSNKINIRIERLDWMRRLELVKWNYNKVLEPHRDGHTFIPDEPEISLSTLIYLNDDYVGGEISFPDYKISIKPKARELIVFPSYFLHEVKETEKKENGRNRCTLPMFYTFEARKFGEYTHRSYLEQVAQFENKEGEYFSHETTERKVSK
jgi:hypothetical protein